MRKSEFYPGSRGTQGGDRRELLCNAFFFLQSKSFVDTSIFFYFGISNCFVIAKEECQKKYSGIKLIVRTQIWKIWFVCVLFFFVFLEYRTRDTRRTSDWKNSVKNNMASHPILSLGFFTCPHPEDSPGHFQLSLLIFAPNLCTSPSLSIKLLNQL